MTNTNAMTNAMTNAITRFSHCLAGFRCLPLPKLVLVAALTLAGSGCVMQADDAVRTTSVSMRNMQFVPKKIRVKVSQTVTWSNPEADIHDVVGDGLGSNDLALGQSYSFTFTKPGTIEYGCSYHEGMFGTVIVEP
jgi:plastocyanin